MEASGRGRGLWKGTNKPPMTSPVRPAATYFGGRGRQKPDTRSGAWTKHQAPGELRSNSRFEDAAAKINASVQKFLSAADEESNSSEEDLEDEEIVRNILFSYAESVGSGDRSISADNESLMRTKQLLADAFKSGSSICLICIESIKRMEAVWSCESCSCMLHLPCIQKWVKEGVHQATSLLSEENFPQRDINWHCPKCRKEYKQSECPSRYYCFCGKVQDPKFDPWLVPHSCGQKCNKPLSSKCGHSCLLLCHPGPCPPCPQVVKKPCFCGRGPVQPKRCSQAEWSCGKPCKLLLTCKHHKCSSPCHKGDCPACPMTSVQPCKCGRQSVRRPCASPQWQCDKVCEKPLSCGHHVCEKVCHDGDCGHCPRMGERTCPCGKSKSKLPCTEDVPTCGDTCEKVLSCAIHYCIQMCHTGPCAKCRQLVEKRCRCGARKKSVLCGAEYTCETKCSRMKNCSRHACKRKCCDGNCPPCEQACGRMLPCRNHKCPSPCHPGPCYPCPLTVSLTCACGATKVTVPCGREKTTRPPRCNALCRKPPICHHKVQEKHRCHSGKCPPCRQCCDIQLPCGHRCPNTCHTAVLVKLQEKGTVVRAGPWEPAPQARVELVKYDCRPCIVAVPVTCHGKHEITDFACSEAAPYSCGRNCGQPLACGNHRCTLECHVVKTSHNSGSQMGEPCEECDSQCDKPRPEGCTHACLEACHPGDCPPCTQMLRCRCHCQLVVLHNECSKWNSADDEERELMQSCKNQCPRELTCKHRCPKQCHSGPCLDVVLCTQKKIIRCPCKRRKTEALCREVQAGDRCIECDDGCKKAVENKKTEEEKKRLEAAQEEEKARAELEKFERMMSGPKRKPRKRKEVVESISFWRRYWISIVLSCFVAVVAYYVFLV